ncbi:MAG: hypothetical protein K2M93_09800 [Muribaculaceae bacterium]|nr:hypothetical protein [Muribaculaceae bacterium]
MKNLFYLLVALIIAMGITACSKKQEESQKWEYKILSEDCTQPSKFGPSYIDTPLHLLNKFGSEGWELVDVYTSVETVHPNFGNDRYVTGLQPNTRTHRVFFVFKRPILEVRIKGNNTELNDSDSIIVLEEEVTISPEELDSI